jgi:hypothetical protein
MFVVMALVTTFMTTPLTSFLYPKWYQDKVMRWRRGEIDWDGNPTRPTSSSGSMIAADKLRAKPIETIAVYLRLDSLSSVCTFVSLLSSRAARPATPHVHHSRQTSQAKNASSAEEQLDGAEPSPKPSLQAHGLRLMELTDRLSSTMKVSEIEEYSIWDPVVNVFRSFGQLNNIPSDGRVAVVPEHSFADSVVDMARNVTADFLLVPWSASGSMSDRQSLWSTDDSSRSSNAPYPAFVSEILSHVSSDVGILVDRALEIPSNPSRPNASRSASARTVPNIKNPLPAVPSGDRNQHVLFLYFGGADDRFALRMVLQLAQNELVTATIVHVDIPASPDGELFSSVSSSAGPSVANNSGESSKGPESRVLPLSSTDKEHDQNFFKAIRDSLPAELSSRVVFRRVTLTHSAATAASLAVSVVQEEATQTKAESSSQLVIVGRRSVGGEPSSVDANGDADTRMALGVVGEALVRRSVRASVLVVQASDRR